MRYCLTTGPHVRRGGPCLVDIKEAVTAAAPRHAGFRMPRNNASRVVEGARHLSPFLGDRMAAARVDGAPLSCANCCHRT